MHRRAWLGLTASIGLAIPLLAGSVLSASAEGGTFYVARSGNNTFPCTHALPCRSTSYVVSIAPPGSTIYVEASKGAYQDGVTITKQLTLIGLNNPVLDATFSPTGNGFLLSGPGASGSVVRGFTVINAKFEGILAQGTPSGIPIRNVYIAHNVVKNNNTGFAAQSDGECASPAPNIPGDCGEGIHLWTATDSTVLDNTVSQNAGGILLTDEFGPTHRNTIANNRIFDNPFDCAITLAGHNGNAVATSGANAGKPQPSLGGIYDNTIRGNVVTGNGIKGEGGGILMAAAGPGAGVYDNQVRNNWSVGNGLSGVVIHSHFAFQDLNNNQITGNHFALDNLTGDHDFSPADDEITGILIASGLAPGLTGPPPPAKILGTIITGNTFTDLHFGVWALNGQVGAGVPAENTFGPNVAVPVSRHFS